MRWIFHSHMNKIWCTVTYFLIRILVRSLSFSLSLSTFLIISFTDYIMGESSRITNGPTYWIKSCCDLPITTSHFVLTLFSPWLRSGGEKLHRSFTLLWRISEDLTLTFVPQTNITSLRQLCTHSVHTPMTKGSKANQGRRAGRL